jgi:hypothetical protein
VPPPAATHHARRATPTPQRTKQRGSNHNRSPREKPPKDGTEGGRHRNAIEEKETNIPKKQTVIHEAKHLKATHALHDAAKTKTPVVPQPVATHQARHATPNAATHKSTGKQPQQIAA